MVSGPVPPSIIPWSYQFAVGIGVPSLEGVAFGVFGVLFGDIFFRFDGASLVVNGYSRSRDLED